MPPWLVGLCFLVAVVASLACMAYTVWRGSKPSEFFSEAVAQTYSLTLPAAAINGFYTLKEEMRERHAPDAEEGPAMPGDHGDAVPWVRQLPQEQHVFLKAALMRRLVSDLTCLNQIQRDKPGNWKLWRGKLVSEQYWMTLVEAERIVSEEIESCLLEAEELEAGWRDQILPGAIQMWRVQQERSKHQEDVKLAGKEEKKAKERDIKRQEAEQRAAEEAKIRQEKQAAKAMEQLLREEEQQKEQQKVKGGKPKATAAKPRAKRK